VTIRLAQWTMDVCDVDLMADFWSDEVHRLLDLGASHADVGQQPDDPFVVLADPEGNEFCLLRNEPRQT
jgi:hypothetical protein